MKAAIIGYGFVGKALHNAINDNVDVLLIDPKLGTSVEDAKDFFPDIIFICVPTPMNDDGTQDLSILESVTDTIAKSKISSLVVLKSTVLPDCVTSVEKKIKSFIYNPEFLRESSADDDFINAKLILIGGKKRLALSLSEFYKNHTKCTAEEHQFTDLISASFVKYAINTFLATKVTFFNQLNNIFTKSGSNNSWEEFIKILSTDSRIGLSHMKVPGQDGKRGFGGACFPKDVNALYKFSEDLDEPFTILKHIIKINNDIRSKYKSLDDREIEQNINFKNNQD